MQTMVPQFSVILPTSNRSFIVESAILSVIEQSYQNWELIIVDNDSTDATYRKVEKYIGGKVKYIRNGNLPMHGNWQSGLSQVTGNYITVLEDKARYAPYAFEILNQEMKKNGNMPIYVWGYIFNETAFPQEVNPNAIKTYHFKTSDIIQLFLNENHDRIKPIMPKMIFSCCHRSILDRCEEKNQDLFQPVSPDYTSMFIQLSFFDELMYIDTPLVNFNNTFSNGKVSRLKMMNNETVQDFTNLTLGGQIDNCYTHTEIRLDAQFNALLSDFNKMKRIFGGNLSQYSANNLHVYKEAFRQAHEMKLHDLNTSREREELTSEIEQYPSVVQKLIWDYEDHVKLEYHKAQYEYANTFVIEIINHIIGCGKRIVIWGAGITTQFLLLHLTEEIRSAISYIVDSDVTKHGQTIFGVMVHNPDYMKKSMADFVFVSTPKWQHEVSTQIRSMGLSCKVLSPATLKELIAIDYRVR